MEEITPPTPSPHCGEGKKGKKEKIKKKNKD
jgi:hypothetical protein